MFQNQQASIAVFGYRHAPSAQVDEIVQAIDAMLQSTDAEPRTVTWVGESCAMIDRIGVRIAIGLLPHSADDSYTHLAIAVGHNTEDHGIDDMLSVSHPQLADRLVYRIREDMPYDTIMRGETPETVDETLILSIFDLLRQAAPAAQAAAPANLDSQPERRKAAPRIPAEERFDVILSEDVPDTATTTPSWAERRAASTKPLRLTVHTVALSIMLYTAPLGAFLFTYSMLRDVTSKS